MEIEQLKLILETLQHTADGAKDFGVWWIALHYGVQALKYVTYVLALWGIAWGAVKAVQIGTGFGIDAQRLMHLRDLLRVGSPGVLTPREFDEMRDKIKTLMAKEKANA